MNDPCNKCKMSENEKAACCGCPKRLEYEAKMKKEVKRMVPTEKVNLAWKDAWFWMLNGKKVKRALWAGYWAWENNTIMMHCRDGSIIDIRETENPAYTFTNIAQRDWMVVEED